MIDTKITDAIEAAGVDTICSVPCNMLAGILQEIGLRQMLHIPVCREEEGVGIAAGAALAGRKPMLLMQNSGLGNSVNAVMSLTRLYGLPLFMLMSLRGGPGEPVAAQEPMGISTPLVLKALNIDFMTVRSTAELAGFGSFIKETFVGDCVRAAFLARELWHEAQ